MPSGVGPGALPSSVSSGTQVSWEDQLVSDFTLMNGGPLGYGEEEQIEGEAEGERKARRQETGAGVTGREGRTPGQGMGAHVHPGPAHGDRRGRLCSSWTQHRRSPNRVFVGRAADVSGGVDRATGSPQVSGWVVGLPSSPLGPGHSE